MSSSCNACLVRFDSPEEMREHFRSDWHMYNSRRKLTGLVPISKEIWDLKWKQMQERVEAVKGSSHKKQQPVKEKPAEKRKFELYTWKAGDSLFDFVECGSIEESLVYMQKTFSFFIPDREYVKDLEGLLRKLASKIYDEPHQCIYCNKLFPDQGSVRRHMVDKGHTRIGTQDDNILVDIDDFYDFSTSIQELHVKKSLAHKKQAILDAPPKAAALEDVSEEAEEGEDAGDNSDDDWVHVGSDEDSDDEEDDADVIECDDEEEFRRIMADLGLQPVRISDITGDLVLPNGSRACHRSVAYVYKQRNMMYRGYKPDSVARAITDAQDRAAQKAALVLAGNNKRGGWVKIATRAEKRGQKRVVAVLRRAQHEESKLAVKGHLKSTAFKRRMDQNMPHFMKG